MVFHTFHYLKHVKLKQKTVPVFYFHYFSVSLELTAVLNQGHLTHVLIKWKNIILNSVQLEIDSGLFKYIGFF